MDTDIIKKSCNFKFYYNKTDITPTILDGGKEIILANWPNDKHIIWNINNDKPVRISSHPYVLVSRSVLCSCGIEADNQYLIESLVDCDNSNSKLTLYFTVNTAFVNYLDMFPNLTDSLEFPVIKKRTTFEQTLPTFLSISRFDETFLTASTDLTEFINRYTSHKEIFDLQERHDGLKLNINKKFLFDNYPSLPVSNLPSIGKLMVSCVIEQLMDHIHANNLMEPLQSAYKSHHSTETALLKVKADILKAMDNQEAPCLVLLDLSATFDMVDHKILLERLENYFGINSIAL